MKSKHILMAILVPFLWGTGLVCAKAGTGQFPPILLMLLRFLIAGLVLVWFVRPPVKLMARIFVITFVSATIPYSTIFTGLTHLDASTTILVVQAEIPFMSLLAVVLLKERMTWRKLIGLVVAFAGIVMIAGQPQLRSGLFWVGMVMMGGFVWAAGQIMIRKIGPLIEGLTLIAWVAVFTVPQLAVSSWIFESGQWQAIVTAGWKDWALVLYMGLMMTALAYTVWYSLLAQCEVTLAGPFLLLQPVVGVIGSILFLGETPTIWTLVGGIVVIGGIAIVTVERPAKAAIAGNPEAGNGHGGKTDTEVTGGPEPRRR